MKPLTLRQLQVFQLLADGKKRKDIGLVLGIAENTVKVYLQAIVEKLNAESVNHALAIGFRTGILT